MANEAFNKMNDAVIEFILDYRDSDPLVAKMQRAITELAAHYGDVSLSLSKRLLSFDMADKLLRALLGYIEQEYSEEFRTFPHVSVHSTLIHWAAPS